MTTQFPGFPSPAATFEAPLAMLAACHERIEAQCATLQRLAAHVAKHGGDDPARTAARGIIRYFDTAGRHHHDDEEHDLFPALIESMAGSDPVCIRELIESLKAEHRELDRRWQALRGWLAQIETGTSPAPPPPAQQIGEFVDGYERHIAREESELLPMAERLLDDHTLAMIGRTMSERRGAR
jgi:hemerythrin-like domain-containing protein